MDNRIVIVLPKFREQTKEGFEYLKLNSHQNEKKFIINLDKEFDEIAKNPFGYPKLFLFQSGDYRFCKYMKSWKIIFRITKTHLIFLGIIHSARHNNEILKLK